MGKASEARFWDPDQALLVTAARIVRGDGRGPRRRRRNPDEAAALALVARDLWHGASFVERLGDKTFRLVGR